TSDGTDTITFRDPATFESVRSIKVTAEDTVIPTLNELEWIEGEIWANVWKREYLVRIDPKTGSLTGWVDLRGLFDADSIPNPDSVLNGIAYDAAGKRIFVTGKLWPQVFEIEVVPAAPE
ncbi:MAG: glutaminyl-peptide cyclotransferase, partial [Planctomycetota bacterium]